MKRLRQKLSRLFSFHQQHITPESWLLDQPLLQISNHDLFTIRDACEGVQIFGSIGSGKTSGSGAALAKSFLRFGFGGLVLCAKPEERKLWEHYAKVTGRSKQLIVFSDLNPWRFNFLDYEFRRAGKGGGLTENLVNLLIVVTEIVEGKQGMMTGDPFWNRAMQELLRNAVDLLTISQPTLSLEDICRLVQDAPQSHEQIGDDNWQAHSFCAQCIRMGDEKEKTDRQQHDFDVAVNYWLKSFANLAERTRSSVVATFTSIADMLLHGIARELFCTTTNLVPEIAYQDGAIIVLDMSIQEYDQLGRIAQGIFKYMFQRAILRRDVGIHPRPVFLWADEAQNFISRFDFQYQSVARSARACTVYLTQNINNYYAVLGNGGRDQANALLGNFVTKIFHANNGDTNQYAADIISQHQTTSFNFGMSHSNNGTSQSGGGSDSLQYKVLPAAFTILRKGGPANRLLVDAIIFQGGRIFHATGDTWMQAIFRQGD